MSADLIHSGVASGSPLLGQTYSREQAADIAGCDIDTLSTKASQGEVPAIKWGRDWRFPALAFHLRLNELAGLEAQRRADALDKERGTGLARATKTAANDPVARPPRSRTPPPLPGAKKTA